jgi:hypothetical protein
MSSTRYKALLAGAAEYGDGFHDLPSATTDVRLLEASLRRRGFDVQVLPDSTVANATDLEKAFRDFCHAEEDDVRLIYFSGHGVTRQASDAIVPARTSLESATKNSTSLVDTDLSADVADGRAGLVLLIVDACRDGSAAAQGWGAGQVARNEVRFVRFMSVTPDAASVVLSTGASAFTQALCNVLNAECAFSLSQLHEQVERECRQLVKAEKFRSPQIPTLKGAEETEEKRLLFAQPWIPAPPPPGFDGARLHVVTIEAEDVKESLGSIVGGLLKNVGRATQIWDAFRASWKGRRLLRAPRPLDAAFSNGCIVHSRVSLASAFGAASFDETIRRVVEADIAIVDATEFQAGAMFLLGVRAATNRGVTIVTKADVPNNGSFPRPFLLVDVSYENHAPSGPQIAKADPRYDRLLKRITTALDLMASDPSYADLPLYAALRVPQVRRDRIGPIDVKEGVFLLCSYDPKHWPRVEELRRHLDTAFSDIGVVVGDFQRFLDLAEPRLSTLGLADQLRRAVGCVVDWTDQSPSVFFECGIRMAINARGAIHVHAPGCAPQAPSHVAALSGMFRPVPYEEVKDRIAEYVARKPETDASPEYRRVYDVVSSAVGVSGEAPEGSVPSLFRIATSIRHPLTHEEGISGQVLFEQDAAVRQAYANLGKEALLVAWLFERLRAWRGLPPLTDQSMAPGELEAMLKDHLDLEADIETFKLINAVKKTLDRGNAP